MPKVDLKKVERPTRDEFLSGSPLPYWNGKFDKEQGFYTAVYKKGGGITCFDGKKKIAEAAVEDDLSAGRFYDHQIPEDLSIPPGFVVTPAEAERRKQYWKDNPPTEAKTPTSMAAPKVEKAKRLKLSESDPTIKILVKDNPCVKGKESHRQFELLKSSGRVKRYVAQGGKRDFLSHAVKKKWISLDGK